MRVKIFLVLLFCALQQIHGSKSKKKGGSRLKNIFKNCLIALAVSYDANEFVNARKPQVADSNFLYCKYNVPDQNAGVMMKFIMCAKDQDFEKYMSDNSENCPKIKELYEQAESDENCAFNTSKYISDGALARFRGEKLSHATNVEMLKRHLLSYSNIDGAFFKSKESLSDFLRNSDVSHKTDFDFFQFKGMLELTNPIFRKDPMAPVFTALRICSKYKDINADNAKRVLEVAKLAYPNDAMAALSMALRNEYKDINANNAKKLFGLTKLVYPGNASTAVSMALRESTNINADNARNLFELTKLVYPNNPVNAVSMALDRKYKDVNAGNAKRVLELTKLAHPDDTRKAALMALALINEYKYIDADNAKRVLELTKLAYPNDAMVVAVSEAFRPKYKEFNVDKVNKKYQELKNSWSWYRSNEEDTMKKALKMTYPEVVKEDF